MKRYFLEVAYDGTAFHGSQLQGTLPTVQFNVNKALTTILRSPIESFGASRTDEGVHGLGSYYHFDFEGEIADSLLYKLNALFPPQMAAINLYQAKNPALNARFDAISRRYRYKIYHYKDPFQLKRGLFHPYGLDLEAMKAAASVLKDYTDFETFSKKNTQSFTFNCTIFDTFWEQVGDQTHFVVEANRFLRGMVRALVGTQIKVGRGIHTVQEFRDIIESKDCSKADFSVTGNGLYLESIKYPADSLILLQSR